MQAWEFGQMPECICMRVEGWRGGFAHLRYTHTTHTASCHTASCAVPEERERGREGGGGIGRGRRRKKGRQGGTSSHDWPAARP
jgi:hypothetical protein